MRLRAFPECVGPRILLLESVTLEQVNTSMVEKKINQQNFDDEANWFGCSTSSPGLFSQKWVGREKALASAGHVYSINIPEKLIYMQPAGFALTEGSNNGK